MKKNRTYGLMEDIGLLKMIKMMRFTIFILFISLTQAFAVNSYSQQTKLTLEMRNASVEDVIDRIEKNSEFFFMYNKKMVDVSRKVDINVEGKSINVVLNKLFDNTDVSYTIKDRQILLINSRMLGGNNELSTQQQKTVSGKVIDSSGAPLPGVTVMVKGTTVGTITDGDGKYTISNVSTDATLVFSFVGMKKMEIPLGGKTKIDITLIEESVGIDEVVAIGYGTQRKVAITGSIVSTKGTDLIKSPAQNLANSLTGRLPGVIINTRSGEPGYDDPTILIRGRSTTGNADPLIIIDGIERSGLGRLNPNDIENVTVLKDASAAIYGARAANGVILVTTKRGSETDGKPLFEFDFNQGFTQPTRKPILADSYTFGTVQNEYRAAQGLAAKYSDAELQKFKDGSDPVNYPNTNWENLMIKTLSPTQRADISVSGGSKKMKYFVSVGGLNQPDQFMFGTETYKQYNFRSNIDVKVTDYFKFGFDLSGRQEDRHRPLGTDGSNYSHLTLYLPMWQLYWPGTNYLYPCRDGQNIINKVSDAAGYTNQQYRGITSTLSFKLDFPWVKGLWVDGSANYDAGYDFSKTWNTPSYVYNKDATTGVYSKVLIGSANASLSEYFDQNTYMTVNAKINFKRSFEKHNVEAMAGYEQRQTNYDYLYASRNNFISPELPQLFAGSSAKSDQSNNGTASVTARQNYFGRATYDYAGKYLAQAIFRYDGSQNFAKGKRWGFFPGFSVGWRLSEESFMKNLTFVNNLKIRASYGEMGNDQVNAFQYLSSYGYNSNYATVIGGADISGLTQSGVPNPNITWEVAKTSNLGLEATLWDNLLGIELDVFKTRRSNILTTRNAVVPDYTGLALPNENVGIVENRGIELQLSHVNNRHAIKYNLTGNFSFARNKVIFADEAPAAEPYQLATGRPIGSTLYYKAIGIFRDQTQINDTPHLVGATPGDIIFLDANNDGVIDSRDRIRINETPTPEIVYGFTALLNFKGFDLSVLFQGQANANTYSNWYGRFNTDVGNFFAERAKGRWTPNNIDATMPRNDYGGNSNLVQSTQWLHNAAFLRLKNLELGYSLPNSFTDRLKMQKVRVFVNGFNLFYVFDHLKEWGTDPEANNTTWYYSQQRVLNMGFNLTF